MKQYNKTGRTGKKDFERSGKSGPRLDSRGDTYRSNSASRSEGKFDRRDSDRSNGRDSGPELTSVICDKCGKQCEVPFKPTSNKPVFCRSCFRQTESGESSSRFDSFEPRGRSNDRFEARETRPKPDLSSEELDKINRKLDKIMKALNVD